MLSCRADTRIQIGFHRLKNMHEQGISEIVGVGRCANGEKARVYRALRPLMCAGCGETIKKDELFTRREFKSSASPAALRLSARCARCVPFALRTEAVESRTEAEELPKRSALLDALLTPSVERASRLAEPVAKNAMEELTKAAGESSPPDESRARLKPAAFVYESVQENQPPQTPAERRASIHEQVRRVQSVCEQVLAVTPSTSEAKVEASEAEQEVHRRLAPALQRRARYKS